MCVCPLVSSLAQSSCPPLVAPAHGRKFGSKYQVGHEVHFTCSQGHRMIGPGTRVCQENGTWSGVSAVCKGGSKASNECVSYTVYRGTSTQVNVTAYYTYRERERETHTHTHPPPHTHTHTNTPTPPPPHTHTPTPPPPHTHTPTHPHPLLRCSVISDHLRVGSRLKLM